ncbi:MAG TPA: class I SAM-dependent methyltransferase [Bacteroidales bacterium]|nr:class I SAM-dependent methyltransferase [Bacteroidales bacterium]
MWFQIKEAFKYYLFSRHKKGHAIHSPFVFGLITEVFLDKTDYPEYKIIEQRIKLLKKSKQSVHTQLYGAKPSAVKVLVKIKSIAKKSTISPRYGRLLFRLVRYYKAQQVLELGSCLGVSTSYLALANKTGQVWSIEASDEFAQIANETVNHCEINNVEIINGTFEEKLCFVLDKISSLDVVFIDGNHTFNATLKYFDILAKKAKNNTLIILDDIYWSKDMYRAWKEIQKNEKVTLTVDIHRMGLVFFKKEIMVKQHFVIRF